MTHTFHLSAHHAIQGSAEYILDRVLPRGRAGCETEYQRRYALMMRLVDAGILDEEEFLRLRKEMRPNA